MKTAFLPNTTTSLELSAYRAPVVEGIAIEKWVGKVEEIPQATRKVFGYNHLHGFVIESSIKMLSMLGAASTDQQELLKSVCEKLEVQSHSQ